MSKNPLPHRNPRRQTPKPLGKEGGINWGGKIGSGCWIANKGVASYLPLSHALYDIDRKASTLSD